MKQLEASTCSHCGCVTLMKERFTLNRLVNRKIVKETFNSDLDCKCQIASNYSLGQEEFIFQ